MIVKIVTGGNMRRIIKLTPDTIKKIIKEERAKIAKEQEYLIKEEKQKLLKKLRLLKKIKTQQINSLSEAKKLNDIKKRILSSIKRGNK